jgi:hypothetical protein
MLGCTRGDSLGHRSELHVRGDACGEDVVAKGRALSRGAGEPWLQASVWRRG